MDDAAPPTSAPAAGAAVPGGPEAGAPAAKNHDVYFVPGLARGLRALEAVGAAGGPLTITEIGRELGLGRSSAFRLVYTLAHMRFLEPDGEGRRYGLGPRVLNLGFAWLAGQDLIRLARPELERLAQEAGVAAHLAIRDARDVLYLDAAEPAGEAQPYVSNVKIGARRPAHASPMGWLLLSDLTAEEIAALYHGAALQAVTEHTPGDPAELAERAAQAGRDGHVVSRGLLARGGASLCAPILDRHGRLAAAIDVSAPEAAFHRGSLEAAYLPAVKRAAARISARLGACAPHAAARSSTRSRAAAQPSTTKSMSASELMKGGASRTWSPWVPSTPPALG